MSTPDRSNHRNKLLKAARRLLREREYANITARDLVSASGTNLGSIGYHFGSKEALLNEAIGLALEEWADAVIGASHPESPAGPFALMRSLTTVIDEYESIRPYYQAFIEALSRSARSPELRRQLAAHYNRQRDRVAGWVAESVSESIDVASARQIASIMIGTVDGLLIQTFISAEDAPTGRDLARVTAKAMEAVGRAREPG